MLFDYAEGGLMIGRKQGTNTVEQVAGGPLQCFEVAGSNRVFVAADAVIDADTVLVSASSVPEPEYVRYCYTDVSNGTNRLYNAAGLPAAAFRSDESYELFVANGSGSVASAVPGSVSVITADPAPAGMVFDRWIGGAAAIADTDSESATVTMPGRDLYIIAAYRDRIAPDAAGCSHATPHDMSPKQVIHMDDFDNDLSQWVVEQMPGGTTTVKEGQLDINDAAGCTVWFRQKLKEPVMIEYEAAMIDQGGPHDRVSDLNCFWMAIDPENPDDLFADRNRGGKFGNYHPLRLYYVGYGANDNTTTRFRRYPGDGSRPCLTQHDLRDKQFMHTPNRTMKIQIVVDGSQVRYFRDGACVFDFVDENPYAEGWFGFRTVRNHMRIDNFRVYRLQPKLSGQEHASGLK